MTAVGGPVESVSFNGRYFTAPHDVEVNRKIGGFQNEVQPNGDKTARLIKSIVAASIDGLTVAVDDFLEDHEYLQNLTNLNDFFDFTITYSSGAVWSGRMQITGDLQYSNANATCTCSLMGTETLTQQ